VKVPPLEGFREVKVDKRQNEMHPYVFNFNGYSSKVGINRHGFKIAKTIIIVKKCL
jgi:hypothetical protein